MRKSRLCTLLDPLRIRELQDEVEADYMQHSQVPRTPPPLPSACDGGKAFFRITFSFYFV
jgi:hypothetical protein